MPMLFLFAFLLSGATAPTADHGRISVVLQAHQVEPREVTLLIRKPESASPPIEMVVRPGASASMDLPAGTWSIDVRNDDQQLWYVPQQFFVSASGTTQLFVDVWPRTTLVGKIATKTKTVPEEVKVRFEPAAPARSGSVAPSGEVRCPVKEKTFTCSLPAGDLNLRLRPSGYIAQYFSALSLGAGNRKDLGTILFREGQSITGRVQLPNNFDGDVTSVIVTSEPMFGTGRPANDKMLVIAAKPDKGGFFHLDGVAPGAYAVRARYGQVLYSPAIEVEVRLAREAELIDPLVLDFPRELRLTITPALAPANKPWHIRLAKLLGEQNLEPVSESNATVEGKWQSPRLQPARYQISIGTIDGDVWDEQMVDLVEASLDAPITLLPGRELQGSITVGQAPLQGASLTFSQSSGSQITTQSDAEGKFQATVPQPREESINVHIEANTPTIQRRVKVDLPADGDPIDIELPASGLIGEVVDATGAPVHGAIVYIGNGDNPLDGLIQPRSDGAGKFEAQGLAPGIYSLMAVAFKSESEIATVEVKEDDFPVPVRLVLKEAGVLRGRVVSPSGGVPGARVHARAVDVEQMIVAGPPSGPNGQFAVPVPREARLFDLTVAAAGFPYVIRRVKVSGDGLTVDLEQSGGTLIVRTDQAESTYLVHDGGTVPLMAVVSAWLVRTEALADGSQQFLIAMMDSGSYATCAVEPSQILPFRMSSGRAGGRCMEGALAPFGTLTLDVRTKESQ